MDCYTANWNPLGEEAFYRKFELYTMEWSLKEDLRDCLLAAAPYGGPIALLKNNTRKEKSPSTRPLLEIYSASGLLLASIPWKSGQLVQLGWTASEDLLCIQEDGTVLIYNLFCEFKRHFSMGNEVLQNHVLEAKVFHTEYGTGVAILTGAHRFSLATNIDDLKLRRMPEVPGLQKPPSCWAVLSQDRVTIILLAVGQDLFLLDNTSCSVVTPPGMSPSAGTYLQMAVSFNYRCLALFTDTGYIWMGLATLKEKLCEFNSSIRSPPRQMVWCMRPRSRQRAVVVAWDRQLMVVGNSMECIQFVLDEDSYLVPELDGVRILSRTSHEFLHEIPEASQEIFRIASMAPGALLLEAQKEYEKESQKADEYLREIKDQKLLPEAVSQCIEAAGYEHEPDTQKSLLRPPSGSASSTSSPRRASSACARTCGCSTPCGTTRSASPSPSPNTSGSPSRCCWTGWSCAASTRWPSGSASTCASPRSRASAASWPTGPATRCSRRTSPMRRWPTPSTRSWVTHRASPTRRSLPGLTTVAGQSWPSRSPGRGRAGWGGHTRWPGTDAPPQLLEYEPRSGEQVPLLLKMKRSKLALSKAIESGDTDLVYTVVLHLKNELNRGTFFMTLQNQPVALSLYRQFCKHQERETLKDLYNQDDNHQELGNFHVHSSYSEKHGIHAGRG
ncbi:vacuolar protein sorting-associated protein 16 homolog isoform 3-T3 [Podargus strigoides]